MDSKHEQKKCKEFCKQIEHLSQFTIAPSVHDCALSSRLRSQFTIAPCPNNLTRAVDIYHSTSPLMQAVLRHSRIPADANAASSAMIRVTRKYHLPSAICKHCAAKQ